MEDQDLLAAEAVRRKLDQTPAATRRLAGARERVLSDLALEEETRGVVKEDAVKGLYGEMVKDANPAEADPYLRQIVVGSQGEANDVKRLLAGGAIFDTLAAERSKDEATRFQGGALPPFTSDMLPADYAAPLRNAHAGQTVGPFKTAAGWVVARVDGRPAETPVSLDAWRGLQDHPLPHLRAGQGRDPGSLRRRARVETLVPLALDHGRTLAPSRRPRQPPGPALKGERAVTQLPISPLAVRVPGHPAHRRGGDGDRQRRLL